MIVNSEAHAGSCAKRLSSRRPPDSRIRAHGMRIHGRWTVATGLVIRPRGRVAHRCRHNTDCWAKTDEADRKFTSTIATGVSRRRFAPAFRAGVSRRRFA
ncbi:hypothetical protein, partial [Burkholderia plantarii]|uniref:hypothetical protein n=1 Tax=Burkholderia plantarii TaxID=41899 RepID=UPI001C0DF7C9